MKYDEFAFFNQQLAGMLKAGIPLEGALDQLCRQMRSGRLRYELASLQADLAAGTPIDNALDARKLPDLYKQLVRVGVKGNDLPGVLLLAADHYHRWNNVWSRLKGMMVYPLIVLAMTLLASAVIAAIFLPVIGTYESNYRSEWAHNFGGGDDTGTLARWVILLFSPGLLAALLLSTVLVLGIPAVRRFLAWRLNPFKWGRLAQAASAMAVLLRGGCSLNDAAALMRTLEKDRRAAKEFAMWQDRLAAGATRMADVMHGGRVFPPLFVWLVDSSGDDVAGGFDEAARMYSERAVYGVDMVLYGILPVSVLALGLVVLMQGGVLFTVLRQFMEMMHMMKMIG